MNLKQNQPVKPSSKAYTYTVAPLVVGGEVGCVTLFIVIIALVAGLWLDRTFGTKPVFTLILLLGSAPFSLFLTFWLAKRSISQFTASQSTGTSQVQNTKEEDISD